MQKLDVLPKCIWKQIYSRLVSLAVSEAPPPGGQQKKKFEWKQSDGRCAVSGLLHEHADCTTLRWGQFDYCTPSHISVSAAQNTELLRLCCKSETN